MHSFREVVDALERRDGRLRGMVSASWTVTATACLAFVLALTFTFLGRPLPTWTMPLLAGTGLLAATVAFLVGAHARRPRSRLLLEVDVRLGLDARLSTLLEIEEHRGPKAFSERLFRDVVRIAPEWKRALPIPRRLPFLAVVPLAVVALALALPLLSPPPARSDALGLRPALSAAIAPTAPDSGGAPEARNDDEGAASGRAATGSPAPARSAASMNQRTLSEILSELRPALASSSAAWAPGSDAATGSESEDAGTALHQELERLRSRLEADGAPPSAKEIQTLRDAAAAASPDLAKAVDEAAAASDVEALRRTISQLLSPSASQGAPTTDATRSDVRSNEEPSDSTDATTGLLPSPGTLEDGASSGASAGAKGETSPSAAMPDETPIFDEAGVGDVAPVAAPVVLGESGDLSSYITRGVPVEQASDTAGQAATWTLNPGQVQSLLSARDLPAGAAEIIRDYFQRITEETP
jgi:hypothetical protein